MKRTTIVEAMFMVLLVGAVVSAITCVTVTICDYHSRVVMVAADRKVIDRLPIQARTYRYKLDNDEWYDATEPFSVGEQLKLVEYFYPLTKTTKHELKRSK
jgi:cell division protein FtsL